MKKFCEFLREHEMKIIYLENNKNIKKEQQESYENAEMCYNCKEKFVEYIKVLLVA